jgi:hypothetical protein
MRETKLYNRLMDFYEIWPLLGCFMTLSPIFQNTTLFRASLEDVLNLFLLVFFRTTRVRDH